jgi:phage terminase large subunit-like protein
MDLSESNLSAAEIFSKLSPEEQERWLAQMSDAEKAFLQYSWDFWSRPNQKAPEGSWNTWLVLAGRGMGKTRMGSEWIRSGACGDTPLSKPKSGWGRIALVAETAADARDVMVLGDSGILACHPKEFRPEWSPTNRCLTWPNGVKAWVYNATEPDQLRGPQHHALWIDELAKFRYMQETWDQAQFGLRLGEHPQTLVTTTPRPLPLIKRLMSDPDTIVTRGSTLDNQSNLAANTIKQLYERYGNTRLGRQELEGEILGDIPGALWNRDSIDASRVKEVPEDLERVYVAVDPAVSNNEGSDEHGIIVVGLGRDSDGYARGYVLEDGTLRGSPEDWARKAVSLFRAWSADKIIAEKNQGGDMVLSTLKAVDRSVPVKLVHASRGKVVRAEPISALYEQGRVHHVGRFDQLEDQMCLFSTDNIRSISNGSPDRVDALVWGLTEIFDKITGRRKLTQTENEQYELKLKKQAPQFPTGNGAWLAR